MQTEFDLRPISWAAFNASYYVHGALRLDEVQLVAEAFLPVDNRLRLECVITAAEFGDEMMDVCAETMDALFDAGYAVRAVKAELEPSFALINNTLYSIQFPVRVLDSEAKADVQGARRVLDELWHMPEAQIPLYRSAELFRVPGEQKPEFTERILREEIQVVRPIRDEIVRLLANRPESLFQMNSREFEEFVAELLDRMGMNVLVTPKTRDGGRDILASPKRCPVLLVECKRYSPTRLVGVDRVRSLYGVVEAERVAAGLIVTTSRFTADAVNFAAVLRRRMNLVNFEALNAWIRKLTGQ